MRKSTSQHATLRASLQGSDRWAAERSPASRAHRTLAPCPRAPPCAPRASMSCGVWRRRHHTHVKNLTAVCWKPIMKYTMQAFSTGSRMKRGTCKRRSRARNARLRRQRQGCAWTNDPSLRQETSQAFCVHVCVGGGKAAKERRGLELPVKIPTRRRAHLGGPSRPKVGG